MERSLATDDGVSAQQCTRDAHDVRSFLLDAALAVGGARDSL
ncbi:hypothetical protein [Labilithrix luteola]|nr:hypothetical protein [Labilithrix luteola]